MRCSACFSTIILFKVSIDSSSTRRRWRNASFRISKSEDSLATISGASAIRSDGKRSWVSPSASADNLISAARAAFRAISLSAKLAVTSSSSRRNSTSPAFTLLPRLTLMSTTDPGRRLCTYCTSDGVKITPSARTCSSISAAVIRIEYSRSSPSALVSEIFIEPFKSFFCDGLTGQPPGSLQTAVALFFFGDGQVGAGGGT